MENRWKAYEFIINSAKELMTLINKDCVYEAVNDAYCKAHNRSREDLVGKTISDVWGEDKFQEFIKPLFDKCLAGQEVHSEAWFEFPGSEKGCFEVIYYPYKGYGDIVSHVVVITHDVTRYKLAEKAMKESEERFHQLADASFEGVLIHDNGIIMDANKSFTQISQYDHGELIGMNMMSFIAPESRANALYNLMSDYDKPFEVFMIRKEGERIAVEICGKPITYGGKGARVVALREITEQKGRVAK